MSLSPSVEAERAEALAQSTDPDAARSMFLWLASPEAFTPLEADLRNV